MLRQLNLLFYFPTVVNTLFQWIHFCVCVIQKKKKSSFSLHISLSYKIPFVSVQFTLCIHILPYLSLQFSLSFLLSIYLGIIVFANGPGDQSSIPSWVIPKTPKMVLDASLLNTQLYKAWIKGKLSNSGKGVTPWCSNYWKGSLRVALDYGWTTLYIYICIPSLCLCTVSSVYSHPSSSLYSSLFFSLH